MKSIILTSCGRCGALIARGRLACHGCRVEIETRLPR
jgi:hypothetical protein